MAMRTRARTAQYGSRFGIFLFLLPGLGVYTLLMLYPSVMSLYYSLLNWDGGPLSGATFVGLANFLQMLSDPYLPGAFINDARVLFLCVAIQLPLALVLAFAITRLRRGGSLYRFLYFIPVIVPTATMALIWGFVFTGEAYGMFNGLLQMVGLGNFIQPWLSTDGVVQWVTSIPNAVVGIGFYIVIFIAALVGIPQEYYDAAAIDGAGGWQQLLHITLPSIRGVYVAAMILVVGSALGSYIYPFLITQGGPNHISETPISYSLWLIVFQQNYGYGSALNILIFVLSLISAALLWRFGHQHAA